MSPRRARILELLSEVVPSRYGDARFARLDPSYRPDDPALPPGYSDCGALLCFIGHQLGARDGITRCGVEGVRTMGRAAKVWIEPNGSNRPQPGDFYGLSQAKGGILTHVGVIVDASGDTWTTADAGQGGAIQAAAYVHRPYDTRNLTLGGPLGPRSLAGWFNIDRYPLPPGAPSGEDAGGGLEILLLIAGLFGAWWILEEEA